MTRRPRVNGLLAVVAALAVAALSARSLAALAAGGSGCVLVVAGLLVRRRAPLTVGVALLFVAVLLSGVADGPPTVLLVTGALVVVTYDLGESALRLDRRLPPGTSAGRVQALGALGSAGVATGTVALGAAAYWGAAGGQPALFLVALLAGALAFVLGLGR